ncbi:MAG: class I SAM-dependent methyltransferase [Candidatus Limnocylindrales bacterium]
MARDWVAWHEDYETLTPLARRLAIVQDQVEVALVARGETPIHVLSLCSGEGRDLVVPLTARAPATNVTGRLVELDPTLAGRARSAIAAAGLTGLEVVEGDAGTTASFDGAVPADLVLVCGVFGNISDEDIEGTIRALPMLCAAGATVIWTRHRGAPDLTPAIRRWFAASGFRHQAFVRVPDSTGSVGVERFVGTPAPLAVGVPLFRFRDE